MCRLYLLHSYDTKLKKEELDALHEICNPMDKDEINWEGKYFIDSYQTPLQDLYKVFILDDD